MIDGQRDGAAAISPTVVLPHLDEAYSLARHLTGNGADAEDIVQDACLRALAALETQQVEQPRAWLLTIVRNVALTFLARRKTPQSPADIGDLERDGRLAAADPGPDAEARLIAADDGAALRRALADLPLALRETLLMRTIQRPELSRHRRGDAGADRHRHVAPGPRPQGSGAIMGERK